MKRLVPWINWQSSCLLNGPAHADPSGMGQSGKGPVVKPAALTKAMACAIKPDQRGQDYVRRDLLGPGQWLEDAIRALNQPRARMPMQKAHAAAATIDEGEGDLQAFCMRQFKNWKRVHLIPGGNIAGDTPGLAKLGQYDAGHDDRMEMKLGRASGGSKITTAEPEQAAQGGLFTIDHLTGEYIAAVCADVCHAPPLQNSIRWRARHDRLPIIIL